MQVHILRNSKGSLSLESLLQIAENVKIIEKRPNARPTQFVIKLENFDFDVLTLQFCPLFSCNEVKIQNYTLKFLG